MAKETTDQVDQVNNTVTDINDTVTKDTTVSVPSTDDTISNIDKILKDPKYKNPVVTEDDATDVDSTDSADDVVSDDTDVVDSDGEPDDSTDTPAGDDTVDTVDTKDGDEWQEVNPAIAAPFIQAALSAGWPVSRVQEYAETHSDEDLMFITNLITNQAVSNTDVVSEASSQKLKDDVKEETFKLDDAVLKQVAEESSEGTANLIKSLAAELQAARSEIAVIKKDFGDIQSNNQRTAKITQYNVANEMFDKVAETMPSIGTTAELPKYPNGDLVQTSPEFKARDKIYTRAVNLTKFGMSFRDAMNDSFQWYRGGLVEQELEGNILKKIKKNEKRLSPKGTGKKMTTKYASEQERRAAIVNDIARKHGSELPQ
jgi:uncharacterized protein YggU (UPF0235/DUF167 family)